MLNLGSWIRMKQETTGPRSTPDPALSLEMGSTQYQTMVNHLREWLPNEGCGLIAMSGARAAKLYPGTNVERSPIRYEMDPKEVFRALREIDARGWRLGAIFHSHPASEAYPSSTDLALMYDPNVFMVIVSFAGDDPEAGVFRYDEGEIQRVPLILVSDGEGADQ
jgi:[CysO sulfur-carrier protein]-S-L-cysteine hydrolase